MCVCCVCILCVYVVFHLMMSVLDTYLLFSWLLCAVLYKHACASVYNALLLLPSLPFPTLHPFPTNHHSPPQTHIQAEPCPRPQGQRAQRATGAAVSVAVGLLECCAPGLGGRVLLMTAGPCTVGPGVVVGLDLAEPFRNHKVVMCVCGGGCLGELLWGRGCCAFV